MHCFEDARAAALAGEKDFFDFQGYRYAPSGMLVLPRQATACDIAAIKEMTHLRGLHLSDCSELADAEFSAIAKLPLQTLFLGSATCLPTTIWRSSRVRKHCGRYKSEDRAFRWRAATI